MCFWAPFLPVNRSPSFWTPFCLSSQPFVARCAASCTRHVPFSASWRLRSWRIAVWSRRRTTPNRRFLSAPRAPQLLLFRPSYFFFSVSFFRPLLLHFLTLHPSTPSSLPPFSCLHPSSRILLAALPCPSLSVCAPWGRMSWLCAPVCGMAAFRDRVKTMEVWYLSRNSYRTFYLYICNYMYILIYIFTSIYIYLYIYI